MGTVLFLYYKMIEEGGFLAGQSSYINHDDFNAYDFINVAVNELGNESLGIDGKLLRQGAVIALLCYVHNSISEEDLVPSENDVSIKLLVKYGATIIPEISAYLSCVLTQDNDINYDLYNKILNAIYEKYVKGIFIKHV